MIYDLIAQCVTIAVVIYFGMHLQSQLRTLKSTVTAQKATIDAQAEQMKAQSTMLQDFERLNKMMKQVIDTVDAPVMIERWQKYKSLVDALLEQHIKEFAEQGKQTLEQVHAIFGLMGFMLPFLPPELRLALFETIGFPASLKEPLLRLAHEAQYIPLPGELSSGQLKETETFTRLKLALPDLQPAGILSTAQSRKQCTEQPIP